MPHLTNQTPYPNFRYYSTDHENKEFGILILKATYEFTPSGRLVPAEEQAPMVFTDICHGDFNTSSLWHPSDLVPHKPGTDVIVNATAHAPGRKKCGAWECGISIKREDRTLLSKQLRVTGPRNWVPEWKRRLSQTESENWRDLKRLFAGWRLGAPSEIHSLPIRYEYSYGGEIPTGQNEDDNPIYDTSHYNPLGLGKIDRDWTDHSRPVAAPQIEAADDPVCEPYATYAPVNFGPIPPAWLPRRKLGGTYDQNWKDNIWPAWPADYSFSYHNSAADGMVISPYMTGDETITLAGLSGWTDTFTFDLPGESFLADLVESADSFERNNMLLDTVFLDIGAQDKRDWRAYLSWRLSFEPDRYERAVFRYQIKSSNAHEVRERLKNARSA